MIYSIATNSCHSHGAGLKKKHNHILQLNLLQQNQETQEHGSLTKYAEQKKIIYTF